MNINKRLSRLDEKAEEAKQAGRIKDYIRLRLEALNFTSTNDLINLHMWRVKAMYFGGDCEFAGFPGYNAGERLWQKGTKKRAVV